MIRIRTPGPSGPGCEAWCNKAVEQRNKVLAYWQKCRNSPTTPHVWRDADAQELWGKLKILFLHRIFHYKCAYCEGRYDAGYPWHVEHYRPKSEVSECRSLIDHPGYFWLAYEWYNLLLSCGHCNTWEEKSQKTGGKSHPSKSNEFRIVGKRVTEPGPDPSRWLDELKEEKPLLLNPYFDDPDEHLGFTEEGEIYGKTDRGKETVEVCNLGRKNLVEARLASNTSVFKALNVQLLEAENGVSPPDRYFGPEVEFSAWKNFWAMVLIRRISPGGITPPSPDPAPAVDSSPGVPLAWPRDLASQSQAALSVLGEHPEGLTSAQLVRSFRQPQNVRILELLDLLVSIGKVRTDVAGRYSLT
jgi:uncharacterized protein (TIGR02646 family)